ncbi:MAG TPA: hypothetical protein DDZ80_18455 [Cyanobacteria bacterium UBA8803]|nr:hypothetical protein [Cyanobacteria bacterium UBA9273]HBL60362.1 hypothetical protein [Cyanobacteria bacterium UBA8803]
MFNFNFFPLDRQKDKSKLPMPPRKASMVEKAIKRLYEVPGITNISHHLYLDKASVYVKFKDGSGNLRLFINTLKVPHVYIFDKKNVCLFAGYVGWIHSRGLEEAISGIKKDFDEDSAQ